MRHILVVLFALGAMTAVPGWSLADDSAQQQPQQPQPPDPEEEEQEEETAATYSETVVVTASKVETQIVNAPATVSVVTSETIENSGAQNYGDLLRTVPGANVSQTSARDINVTSRGATSTLSTSQLALLDGRTLYQDFFGFVAWDFLPIDPSEIAQIEVINGPASAVWGANAMTGVVNVISKTPRELDRTTVTLGYGAVNRDAPGSDLGTGASYRVNVTHAQAVNDRWAFKLSGGVAGMDALARPMGTVPEDPDRGTGGGAYPDYQNQGTTQPKFDARVDYDFEDGRQKLVFAGGYAGTEGIIHTGIGPFDIQSGTAMGYGKINYTRDNWKVNFFTNVLDGEAPAILAIGTDGRPINFTFQNNTYDFEVGNSQLLGTKNILTYGGNFRFQDFELSIAPNGSDRTEGGFYVQDEIFISDHFRWLVGGRVDKFSILDNVVFSPRTTFMIKPRSDQTFRVSFNRAYRAPSLVNNFLNVNLLQQVQLPTGPFVFPFAALGNEDLKEESLTAYEIGYTGTVADRHTVSAAFYVNQTKNGIFFTVPEGGNYSSANPPPGWPLPPPLLDGPIPATDAVQLREPGRRDRQGHRAGAQHPAHAGGRPVRELLVAGRSRPRRRRRRQRAQHPTVESPERRRQLRRRGVLHQRQRELHRQRVLDRRSRRQVSRDDRELHARQRQRRLPALGGASDARDSVPEPRQRRCAAAHLRRHPEAAGARRSPLQLLTRASPT